MWAVAVRRQTCSMLRARRKMHQFSVRFGGTLSSGSDVDVKPFKQTAQTQPDATSQASVLLYASSTPQLARIGGSLFSLKALVAGASSVMYGWREVGKFQALFASFQDSTLSWLQFITQTSTPLPDFRIAGALAVLAGLSHWVSRRILHRIAVEIRREPMNDKEGDDIITVRHLTLFGTATKAYRRQDCQNASGTGVTTNFVAVNASGFATTYFLLPKDDWHSEDKAYLRRLVYERYFRPDEPKSLPDEAPLTAQIIGFGRFRPAQFADPNSDMNKRLTAAGECRHELLADLVSDSPLRLVNGEVYSEFVIPQPRSMEDQRLIETRRALKMPVDDVTLPSLPPLPAVPLLTADAHTATSKGGDPQDAGKPTTPSS